MTNTTPESGYMSKIRSAAESQYVKLPFHNFMHAVHTAEVAKRISQRAKLIIPSLETAINDEVVEVAALWKDAGRHEIGKPVGHYAAELFRSAARLIDRDKKDRFITLTSEAIITATRGRNSLGQNRRQSMNAIPVFGASVSHMWAPYKNFAEFQNLAYKEYEMLNTVNSKKPKWAKTILSDEIEEAAERIEAEFPLIGISNSQEYADRMRENLEIYSKRAR